LPGTAKRTADDLAQIVKHTIGNAGVRLKLEVQRARSDRRRRDADKRAEHSGPIEFARIATLQAISRHARGQEAEELDAPPLDS
jgi:hypothetical protein